MNTDFLRRIPPLLGVIFILMFQGCASKVPSGTKITATPNSTLPSSPTVREGVQTQTRVMTSNPNTATPFPSPVSTYLPTPTFTLTLAPTLTPFPKLSREDAHALVHNLLETNGGCRLPCWWGIVPGLTDWKTARHFLETFVLEIEQGGEGQIIKDNIPIYSTNFSIRYESDNGIKSGFLIDIENSIISGVVTGWDPNQKNFQIHQLLADYGQPAEVYIMAYRYTSTGDPPPFNQHTFKL